MVITESVIRINFFFCFMGFFGNDEFFVFGACTRNLLSENPFPSISQDAEHRAVGLFFGEQAGVVFVVVLVPVDDDVFGGRNQTVLDAAEAAVRLLIGSRMEEADILRIPRFELGQEDRVDVRFRVVEIFAVAGQAAQQHTLVFFVPVVDRQHDVALVDAPRIGQSRDEGAVDHVPVLAVVLLFLIDDRVEGRAAFADGKRSEFSEYVRFVDSVAGTDVLDLRDDLFGQVLVVVREVERVFDRKAASDVEAVQIGANGLQFAVDVQAFRQFVPVVGRVLDTGIDEEVQHFELELLVFLDLGFVEVDDVVVADPQARGVELEFGLLLAGDPDADFAFFGNGIVVEVDLFLVVDHGDRVFEPVVDQLGDIFDVLRTFEAVADDIAVLVDHAAVVQGVDDVNVVSRGGFEMNVVFHRLFQHEREVTRLGTVAVVVCTLVIDLRHRYVEHALGPVDLLGDLRQVGYLERSAVLLD